MPKQVSKGRANQLLRVDLTSRSAKAEPVPDDLHEKWLGAKGLGAYYLAMELKAGVDPLSDENKLIFSTGPYQGTGWAIAWLSHGRKAQMDWCTNSSFAAGCASTMGTPAQLRT